VLGCQVTNHADSVTLGMVLLDIRAPCTAALGQARTSRRTPRGHLRRTDVRRVQRRVASHGEPRPPSRQGFGTPPGEIEDREATRVCVPGGRAWGTFHKYPPPQESVNVNKRNRNALR